uniref:Putative secreted protein n=1 Tax=Anopheles darlingi TaxID=43151 RepID=A0A2M4DGE7_ANODA
MPLLPICYAVAVVIMPRNPVSARFPRGFVFLCRISSGALRSAFVFFGCFYQSVSDNDSGSSAVSSTSSSIAG